MLISAQSASWLVNWFLLFVKLFALWISNSKAVAAALADSVVDLLSQFILAVAERYISKSDVNYPVGRSRLEAISVLATACIMAMASAEVIQYATIDLISGLEGHPPILHVTTIMYSLLWIGIGLKLVLYVYCYWVYQQTRSDSLGALAEDHLNDVVSNLAAVLTAALAVHGGYWIADPLGAIIISVVIIYRWSNIINEQVKKIVGHAAPTEFVQEIETIARNHDDRLEVDIIRAYHFGARYNVEVEIVLPWDMTVLESHDIALELQHKIEALDDVERAFVHVDHSKRDIFEHKVERLLFQGAESDIQQIRSDDGIVIERVSSPTSKPSYFLGTGTKPAIPAQVELTDEESVRVSSESTPLNVQSRQGYS